MISFIFTIELAIIVGDSPNCSDSFTADMKRNK